MRAAERVLINGARPAEVAAEFGVSKRSVEGWVKRVRDHGWAALTGGEAVLDPPTPESVNGTAVPGVADAVGVSR